MAIPPTQCFTCGKMIAHLIEEYDEKVLIAKEKPTGEKTAEAQVLDELGIKRYCCRRMFLTKVDMSDRL